MLSFHDKFVQTDRRTTVKQYAHDLSVRGHKNVDLQSLTEMRLYPLPHRPILGSSNSAAKKDMMEKIWTNGDTII